MKTTPAICDFCDKGRMVIKLPNASSLLICSPCIENLRSQFDDLAAEVAPSA